MSFFSGLDTEGYDRQYTDRKLTQRIWTYFGPYRVQLIWVAIFTLLIACAEAAIPVLVARVVGELSVTGVAASPIFILTGAVFVVGVSSWAANWIRRRITVRIVGNIVEISRDQFAPYEDWFKELRPVGSIAWKLACIACGDGDLNVSFAPKNEWDVCAGDLGAPAYRKFDLEAWMTCRGERGGWGEITSTLNCTDYQSRRLGVRYRESASGKTRFCHMLNGTAIAASRAPIALIENHQQADGSIRIPKALVPYTGFDRIG